MPVFKGIVIIYTEHHKSAYTEFACVKMCGDQDYRSDKIALPNSERNQSMCALLVTE